MGQKVHPIGFRLPFQRTWNSHWFNPIFSNYNGYTHLLKEDFNIHDYIKATIRSSTDLPKIYRKRGSIYILLNLNYILKKKKRKKSIFFRFPFGKNPHHNKFFNNKKFFNDKKFFNNKKFFNQTWGFNNPSKTQERGGDLSKCLNRRLKFPWNRVPIEILKRNILKRKNKIKKQKIENKYNFKNYKLLKGVELLNHSSHLKKLIIFNRELKKRLKKLKPHKRLRSFKLRKLNKLRILKLSKLKLSRYPHLKRLKLISHIKTFKLQLGNFRLYLMGLKRKLNKLRIQGKITNVDVGGLKRLWGRYSRLRIILNGLRLKLKRLNELNEIRIPFNALRFHQLRILKLKLKKIYSKLRRLRKLRRYKLIKRIKRSNGFKELRELKLKIHGLKRRLNKLNKKKVKKIPLKKWESKNKKYIWLKKKLSQLPRLPLSTLQDKFSLNGIKKLKDRMGERGFLREKPRAFIMDLNNGVDLKKEILRKRLLKIKKNLKWITNSKIRIFIRLCDKKYKLAYTNSSYIGKYLSRALSRPKNKKKFFLIYNRIYRILKKITIKFKNSKKRKIRGFRIKYAGKLWSKGRSKKKVLHHGPLSLQNLNNVIDYSFTRAITKYGVTGFKIWLNYYPRHRSIKKKLRNNIINYKPFIHLLQYKRKIYGMGLLLLYYKNFLRKKIIKDKSWKKMINPNLGIQSHLKKKNKLR